MLIASQLSELIIKPTLINLLMFSDDAIALLLFTCAVESNGGSYLKQIKGPALGIYQMEPTTYNDIWQNYIKNKQTLMTILSSNFNIYTMPDEERLIYDLRFATIMTRIHYARVFEPLPANANVYHMWEYYKAHYNFLHGQATQEESIEKYLAFIKS